MNEWESKKERGREKFLQSANCTNKVRPQRGSDFSHLLLWLNPTCEKHYPALVVSLRFIAIAWCHRDVRIRLSSIANTVTRMRTFSGKRFANQGACFCWNHIVNIRFTEVNQMLQLNHPSSESPFCVTVSTETHNHYSLFQYHFVLNCMHVKLCSSIVLLLTCFIYDFTFLFK